MTQQKTLPYDLDNPPERILDMWRAADSLDAEGTRVTLEAVRERAGGGSYSTISNALAGWKRKRAAGSVKASEPMPAAYADRLSAVGAELWAMALDAANARLEKERRDLGDLREELEVELGDAMQLADRLTKEVEQLRRDVEELSGAKRQCEKLAEQLADQKHRSAEELTRAAARVQAAEAAALADREAARKAAEYAARMEGQVEAYRTQLSELTAAVKTTPGRSRG
ncbi:DNA-binding protein [Eleftheria terrae]|uniref:DNA-binding protein n=1 Tax=Eleftheria terrae TaxID=1597781 RepID=UPI00263A848C|nr:DNA-binding protein [Eleftheria terrae]WKB50545.1 DNA-binding protein [Eleftheria terrae]